jgi:8-oxo-dGDP phosphatase
VSDSFAVEGSETLLESFVFRVSRKTVGNSEIKFTRDIVEHPGAVAILARDNEGRVGFIRQYRAAFDKFNWEIPAGTCDQAGEDLLVTAQRELKEELGVVASHWEMIGTFMVSPGWTNQVMTIFEATLLEERVRATEGPEEDASTVHWLPVTEIYETLSSDGPIDATVAIALHRVFGDFLGHPHA